MSSRRHQNIIRHSEEGYLMLRVVLFASMPRRESLPMLYLVEGFVCWHSFVLTFYTDALSHQNLYFINEKSPLYGGCAQICVPRGCELFVCICAYLLHKLIVYARIYEKNLRNPIFFAYLCLSIRGFYPHSVICIHLN